MFDLRTLVLLAEDWPSQLCLRVLPVTAPAAGADFTVTVPGESTWALLAVSAQLVTSAAVANRVPVIRFGDGTSTYFRAPSPVAITASLTTQVSWVAGLGFTQTALAGSSLTLGLPEVPLAPGNAITVATTALDAGDQWSNVVVTAVEVFNGHVARERSLADGIRDEAEAIAGVIEGTL